MQIGISSGFLSFVSEGVPSDACSGFSLLPRMHSCVGTDSRKCVQLVGWIYLHRHSHNPMLLVYIMHYHQLPWSISQATVQGYVNLSPQVERSIEN